MSKGQKTQQTGRWKSHEPEITEAQPEREKHRLRML